MTVHAQVAAHQVVVKATVASALTKICSLTTRSLSRSVSANAIPAARDCDDPDAVPGTMRIATSADSTISGEARYHKELRATVDALLGISTVMQFILPGTGAEGGGYWQGTYMLTGIDISGEDGDTLVASLTWELDDATLPAWTAAA